MPTIPDASDYTTNDQTLKLVPTHFATPATRLRMIEPNPPTKPGHSARQLRNAGEPALPYSDAPMRVAEVPVSHEAPPPRAQADARSRVGELVILPAGDTYACDALQSR